MLEMILKAKEEGKVRHIGFSAHTTAAALAAMKGFDFDSCMFPINFVEWFGTGYGREVADVAVAKGVSLISIKPVSRGLWPEGVRKTYNWWYRPLEDEIECQLAMDWVLSLPGMVSALPTSNFDVFDMTVAAARRFRPIQPAGVDSIKTLAQSCTPIFKPGPLDEKRANAFLDLPQDQCYPSRLS